MSEDGSSPPMKPQDTVIFLLGELKGGVTALKESVDSSAASQAVVNAKNEADHVTFREKLEAHSTALAVLDDGKKTQHENTLTHMQRLGLWIAVPSGVASAVGIVVLWLSNK
jgi:hypothetical protein